MDRVPADEEEAHKQNGFAHSSPANLVQFSLMGVIGMAEIIVLERTSRSLHRMLTTTMSRVEIIAGHLLAIFAVSVVQLGLMALFGSLVLGVGYWTAPAATLLMIVVIAVWASCFGLLIGVLAKNEDQVAMFSVIPTLVLAGIGGAWMPLEYTPQAFQAIGHLSPVAWAVDGLENVVIRGLQMNSVLLPAGVLLGYACAILILALWLFRVE